MNENIKQTFFDNFLYKLEKLKNKKDKKFGEDFENTIKTEQGARVIYYIIIELGMLLCSSYKLKIDDKDTLIYNEGKKSIARFLLQKMNKYNPEIFAKLYKQDLGKY